MKRPDPGGQPPPPAGVTWAELRASILAWYRRRKRDLPWRRTRDPYAIWVSEVMLQQTRVATVLRYFDRFLDRFPSVAELARANEDDVLAQWTGLGYYRRARALHAGARDVVARFDGRLPRVAERLRSIPGIGRYTAGAISSIAYGLPEPVLDGNVRRLLSRLLARAGPGSSPTAEDRRLWGVASRLVEGPSPGDLNQALMELGATVCTPSAPACDACPWGENCAARALGEPECFPTRRNRPTTIRARVGVVVASRGDRVLLERPSNGSPFRGRWDLLAVELGATLDSRALLVAAIRERHGLVMRIHPLAARERHGILNRILDLEIHPATVERGRVSGRHDVRWVRTEEIDRHPVSGATVKVFEALTRRSPSSVP